MKKTSTRFCLEDWEEWLEEKAHRKRKVTPPEGMVVEVEGEPCVAIPLSNGMKTLVDLKFYEIANKTRWTARTSRHTWYARSELWISGRRCTIQLHRLLLGFPTSYIDHRNRNGLDNRLSNLRLATVEENAWNRNVRCFGVTQLPSGNYRSVLNRGPKRHRFGTFKTFNEAKFAYIEASKRLSGEFSPYA